MNKRHIPPDPHEFFGRMDALNHVYRARKNQNLQEKVGKAIGQIFVFLAVAILLLVTYGFVKNHFQEVKVFVTNGLNTILSTTIVDTSVPVSSCNEKVTIKTSDNGALQFNEILIGHCYAISEGDREQWREAVDLTIDDFAEYIFQQSNDKGITGLRVEEIEVCLKASLDSGILDLRSNPQPSSPQPPPSTPVETQVPTLEPTPFPTPQPTLIGQDTSVIDLDQLVINMTAQGIRTVAGEAEYKEGLKWYMFYQDGDASHYFILDTVDMSQVCITADEKIIISLDPFDQAILTRQVWVLCK